ncbi:MAG: (2Fe-2S)-binding protein [Epsilonproteobacteria bacterium]|nr:(2Fe-2S)-binding protein [Campylobacterota bacterium]
MIDPDTEVCVCNSLTAKDIAECIKKNNLTTLQELLENDECPMGDKCESCQDEGFHNDGINLPLVLSLVKQGKL